MRQAPLKALHAEGSLSQPKLAAFRKLTTDELVDSLRPGTIASTCCENAAWRSTSYPERLGGRAPFERGQR
jgi:hypothetical protein